MPLYEYQCQNCQHRFERIQKFSDDPVTVCPECGGRVEQLLSAPAVMFKGSGWYVTDYARKGQSTSPSAKANGTGESAAGSAEKAGERKSGESKSAESKSGEGKSSESKSGGTGTKSGSSDKT